MRTHHRPFLVSFVAALVLSLVSTAVAGAPTDALKQTVFGSFAPGVAAFQIKTERLQLLLLFDAQFEPKILEDVPGNVFLHKKNV